MLTGKKVLVTGGAGFIGSNLVELLLDQHNKVTVLDNFATGKRENLRPFAANPDFKLIEGDIRDYDSCLAAAQGQDFILHEAALGSVPRSIKDPATSTDVNIGGFVKMLFAAVECKVKRFVYAASSSTYGDSAALPKVEENIGKPLSPYAITKYVNELYAENFHKLYGIDCIGLRYFNVFGRRQSPDGAYAAVIPQFAAALISRKSPVINGDGTYSRDFTYIDNVLSANLLALETENPAALNQVYNVACGSAADLNELFAELRTNLGKFDPEILKIEAVHGPDRPGDIPHSLADISKIEKLLDYKVKVPFAEGIRLAAEFYWHRNN
ncbi:MAG: SDR family oxidoreductase [Lentisphaeria bacterium]|nr:SDR family oxidoreductase [Lentisphaeria bacterium]